ncbi:MAG: polysaccharide deacetylase family protein [Salibacteraceae bacterium]|nr:polysaccharide deacetylase family protein [Salibacteraceae bacterium]MDP4686874.1 polysaccharide deacetylase family protein [Salibacteraceae bacterium]MDP4762747.1 polysaccharide deacetylase family protein [Salibacteraceae bacterium]MDP4963890.1 polysaccharide deacetylase family protein [Salibacteraceae bacterium]
MYSKHFPDIIKPLGRDLFFDLKNDRNAIYVTFDDGPHPEITPWVMEQLALFNAKATFFLVGENAETYPKIALDLINAGHSVGNHTQNHLSGWKTDNATYFDNIALCKETVDTRLLRPPYGQITRSQAKHLKHEYDLIMWSDLSADFDPKYTADECVNFATRKVKSGSIIVFHDSEKAWPRLKNALPKCLTYYAEHGFNMEAIPYL